MERIWNIVALCMAIAAGALLWFHRFDGAFVCAALGILAWFLGMRSRLRKDMPVVENVSEPGTERHEVDDEV